MWRQGIVRVGLVAALLLVSLAAVGTAHGISESLEVFVPQPLPNHIYKVGDSVTLSILVFNYGMAQDADNLTVQLNPYFPGARWVVPTHTGVGAYEATFQIQSTDLDAYSHYGGYSYLSVQIYAYVGSLLASHYTSVLVGTVLEASVTPSSFVAAPGDQVDLSIVVREDAVLTDADAVYMNASRSAYSTYWSTPVSVTRTGTGTYAASYTIPLSINESVTIAFSAEAFLRGNYTFGNAVVFVPLPLKLDVWTHQASVNATSARVEVYAANETGWPVVGANVTMRYVTTAYPAGKIQVDLSGTSDRRGRVSFGLTFPASSYVTFWGNVTKGAARQSYGGSVYPASGVYPPDFAVQRETVFPLYEIGTAVVLNYTVLYHNVSRAGQIVYYYALTSEAVIANGSATTDASGRFQIAFVVPTSSVSLEFSAQVDGVWRYSYDSILGVRPLAVQRGDLRIGGVTHVTGATPSGPGPWGLIVLFVPYNFSAVGLGGPPSWLPGGFFAGYGDVAVVSGPTFTHDLLVPRFLPKDMDYLFAVEMLPINYTVSGGAYTPYVDFERVHITNAPPTPVAALSSANLLPSESLSVDMSGSVDLDGIVDAYRIDWGDGSSTGWMETATARHTFSATRDYTITLQVRDDTGAVAEIARTVHVESGILGMRTTDFAILMGLVVAVVIVAVVLVVWRIRRRPPVVAPPPSIEAPPPAAPPPAPSELGGPPETPPPSS